MKIHVFAILKDFFDEEFELGIKTALSVQSLKDELAKLNPGAASILKSCRFAVNESFVSNEFQVKEDEHIFIIPPSSGG